MRRRSTDEDVVENWHAAPVPALLNAGVLSVGLLVGGGWVTSHGGWFVVPGVLLMAAVVWVIACAVRSSVRLTPAHVLVYGAMWTRTIPRERIVKISTVPLLMNDVPALHWRTKSGLPVWTPLTALYGGTIGYASQVCDENLQKLQSALAEGAPNPAATMRT
jgi:hypothetical protein